MKSKEKKVYEEKTSLYYPLSTFHLVFGKINGYHIPRLR